MSQHFDLPDGLPEGTYTSKDGKHTITIQRIPVNNVRPEDDGKTITVELTGEETEVQVHQKMAVACNAAGIEPGAKNVHCRIILHQKVAGS